MLQFEKYLVFPKAIILDTENTFHIVMPKKTSLYEILHSKVPNQLRLFDDQTEGSILSPYLKLQIAI